MTNLSLFDIINTMFIYGASKMKKIKFTAIFLAIIICALALTSCKDKTGVPGGMVEVVSDYTDFRLFVPDDWTPDVSTGFVSAQTVDGSNVSVEVIAADRVDASSESEFGYTITYNKISYAGISKFFEDYFFATLSKSISGVKLEEQYTTDQSLGDNPYACKYVYTVELNGTSYRIMQIFAVKASKIYIFTYTAEEANYSKHTDDVDKIVKEFVFK